MAISTETAATQVRPVHAEDLTLARFLTYLWADGLCFCCGAPTALLLDESGLGFAHCPRCDAKVWADGIACSLVTGDVRQAA